jgi:hypothetical protein
MIQFPVGAKKCFFFSFHHRDHTDPGAHLVGTGGKADNSLPFSATVKNAWSYTSILPHVFVLCLSKEGIHLHGVGLS